MEIILFLGGVVLFGMVISLWGRMTRLEEKISQLSTGRREDNIVPASGAFAQTVAPIVAQESLSHQSDQTDVSVFPPQTATAQAQKLASGSSLIDQLLAWLREDWLLKLGAFLLLIGFGWLATYAFMNNWIGPMGRIVLGILSGMAILTFGWAWTKNHVTQGSVFLILGATTTILTIFAAREVYDFFTPFWALVAMFLASVFVALASLKYNIRPLAFVGLILAAIVPFLVNAPSVDYVGLFWYLLIVVLGSVWISVFRQWKELLLGSLFIVGLYGIPHLMMGAMMRVNTVSSTLLVFQYVFAAVFFIVPMIAIVRLRASIGMTDIAVGALNGLLLLSWISVIAPHDWRGLILAAWAIVFAWGAFLVFRATQEKGVFFIYAGVAIAFIAAATAVQLSGATLTIAYIIESAVILLVVHLLVKNIQITQTTAMLLLVPAIMSAENMMSSSWAQGIIFQKDFFVLLVFAIVLWVLGVFFKSDVSHVAGDLTMPVIFFIAASLYAFVLVWLTLHALFLSGYLGTMIALVIYTIIGLVAYAVGRSQGRGVLWVYGSVLLVFVVARLLFVDVWAMEMTGRIITFFLVGALLIATAFIGRAGAGQKEVQSS